MTVKQTVSEEITKFLIDLNIPRRDIHLVDQGVSLEIIGVVDPADRNNIIRIVLLFIDRSRQVHIPIIFVPKELRYAGNGKSIIKLVYRIGKQFGYDVFVVDMVESFYQKLIARGAIPVDADSVQIVNSTNLEASK